MPRRNGKGDSRFAAGASVVWRSVHDNRVRTVDPLIVVEDSPDQIVLYLPVGTRHMRRAGPRGGGPRGRMILPGAASEGHVPIEWHSTRKLVLHRPGDAHSVLLFWDDETGDFLQWYGNLEDPWRRTSIGFDSWDHVLDIAVAPDLSWQLKDEDEFEWAQQVGYITPD